MKYISASFIFFTLFSSSALVIAEEFTSNFTRGFTKNIDIELLNGMHVNSLCLKNKVECLSLLKKQTSVKNSPKSQGHVLGNPASIFCNSIGGKSEILKDKKNNEYDFCVLNDKYFIDSWDLYKTYREKNEK